jgi:predicted alpha/beta-hydrolase family hydrolase
MQASKMKERPRGPGFLGGHSYGGRQSSILVSEDPGLDDGLLLCPTRGILLESLPSFALPIT